MKEKVGLRIKQLRKAINKTLNELSEETDISLSNISRIERGEIFPNFEFLQTLHTKFNFNLAWLFTGEGKMFSEHEKINDYLSRLYPHWKSIHIEIAKEILYEIEDIFILTRMSSYLEVAKNDRIKLLSDRDDNIQLQKVKS